MSLDSINEQAKPTDRADLHTRESALIAGLRNGDTGAATEIFNLYFDRLYSMVFYSVDKDRGTAEDITQDTFISALKAINKYKGNSSLYTWLASIANHKIADYYRNLENERKHIPQTIQNHPASQSVSLDIDDDILSGLPYPYRQVLLLKYVEDLPVAEISKIMNRSPKSIEGLLSRARNELRESRVKYYEG